MNGTDVNDGKRKDVHNSDIPLVCQACEARHGGICGALEPSQLLELSKHTQRTAHSPDIALERQAERKEVYSNILSGVVKLTKLMPDGRQQIVGLQFAPDFLGRPFSDNNGVVAEAATNVRLCSFPKAVLEQFIKDQPEMEHRLHEQHMRELDEAREWMLTLGRKTAIEKVASFLLMIASHIDPEKEESDELEIELPLKRSDIADFLGLTIETVSRQLTNLRKKGIIDVNDRKSIVIKSLDQLNVLAEYGTS
ncbi:MAG: Crp/Fnr family transcriptional regulator [Pseudomonadota bacterium]